MTSQRSIDIDDLRLGARRPGPGLRPYRPVSFGVLLILAGCAELANWTRAKSLHAPVVAEPVLARAEPAAAVEDPAAAALRAASGPSGVWTANEGETLKAVLDGWSQRAGWQLRWKSERPYPIDAGARFTGTFPQVAYAIVNAFQRASPPAVITFYPLNRVITVHSLSDGDEEE